MSWWKFVVLAAALGCGLWGASVVVSDERADAAGTPIVTVRFSQNPVATGETFVLYVDVDNQANENGSALSFTTSDIAGVAPTSISSNCGGGLNRTWNGNHIEVVNDYVQGGVKCSYVAALSIAQGGVQTVTVDDLVTSFGTSAPASADITVIAPAGPPGFQVDFTPASVQVGQPTTLTVTIDNSANQLDADYSLTSTAVTDLMFGNAGTVTTDCDAGSNPWSGGALQVSSQTLTAGEICTIEVVMAFDTAGTQSGTVELDAPDYGGSTVTLFMVTVTDSPKPTLAMAFSPSSVPVGQTTTLVITIENKAYLPANFSFSTSAIQHIASSTTTTECSSGAGSVSNGVYTFTNRIVSARTTCSFEIDLVFDKSGRQTVEIDDMTTTLGDPDAASADITVTVAEPPVVSIVLDPSPVPAAQATIATITIDNTANSSPATGIGFSTDPIATATVAHVGSTCGGGGHAIANGGFSTSGRSVPAGQSCTFSLRYVFSTPGTEQVRIDDLVSSLGASPAASTTVQVTEAVPPAVSLSFDPAPATVARTSTLTITVDNSSNAVAATNMTLTTSPVPGATVDHVGQTCGGGGQAVTNGSITLPNRSVAAETTCTITVDYIFGEPGVVNLDVDGTTSSLGTSPDASTTVTVDPVVMDVTATFDASSAVTGRPVDFTIIVDNADNELAATDLALETAAVAGAAVSYVDGTCGGGGHTIGNGSFSTQNRVIAAGGTCRLDLQYVFSTPGTFTATVQGVTSSLGSGASASDTISVAPAARCGGKLVTIYWGPGAVATSGDDVILGTPGPDVIDGLQGDDTICGLGGDDVIDGGAGDFRDFVRGGPGDDTIRGGFGIDYLFGDEGEDTLDGQGGSDRMFGGLGDDLMLGDSGADRMFGGPGDDELRGMGGQDQMWGEAGNDLMQGNFQSDDMFGGPGDDTMFGAGGKDTMFGDAGNDTLAGGDNTDYLNGGAGVDSANGGRGRDKPLTEPTQSPGTGRFRGGAGCIAETIQNCQPTP